jgi:tetratricopeptide (TPR) repeat protein
MTETLITELSKVRSLKVISRTSVMQYKGVRKPLKEIAKELGVDAVVEGSALRVGNRVRITAQLIGTANDSHLWGHDFDSDMQDVLSLHKHVARAIAQQIGAKLTQSEQKRLGMTRASSPEAVYGYLRAVYLLNRRELPQSIALARQAIKIDPQFIEPYHVLADALLLTAEAHDATYADVVAEVRESLHRAMEIDPEHGPSLASSGWARFAVDHDAIGAEPLLRRGFELAPETGCIYGYFLATRQEFDRTVESCSQTLKRDPANPSAHSDMGHLYYLARRYPEAIASFRHAVELNPGARQSHFFFYMAYLFAGKPYEAVQAFH